MLFGDHGYPLEFMEAFGLEPEMLPRYRDHWFEKDGDDGDRIVLAVYTRMGGGNRDAYAEPLDAMHALETYVSDQDDSFDPTYCTLRFRTTKEDFFAFCTKGTDQPGDDPAAQEELWTEMQREATPEPLDMAPVWVAMLAALASNAEKSDFPK